MQLTLRVIEGPNAGKLFTFENHDLFLVGRSPEAHFSLPSDPYFSRNHFLIEFNPPLCRITDLHSRNGTEVNGHKIDRPTDLKSGDRIKGGDTQVEVVFRDTISEHTRTLPPPKTAPGGQEFQTVYGPVVKTGSDGSAQTLGQPKDPIPTVPGYRIVERLGEGGMGVVYRAEREADSLSVAIKMILPVVRSEETTVARFLREAAILKQLQHDHIVSFFDMGEANGLLYFVMEYVEGPNLARLRRERPEPFPVGRAVRLVCQVLAALTHAHSRGFVHRDIKPPNVLVAGSGPDEQAKLADFGLARTYQASPLSGLTLSGTAGGTPQFMAPEQVLDFRRALPAADQYSTSAMLYHLLTGKYPHAKAADLAAFLQQVLNQDARPIKEVRPGLPAPLIAAVDRALKRKPQDRFPSVEVFRQVLLPFAGL